MDMSMQKYLTVGLQRLFVIYQTLGESLGEKKFFGKRVWEEKFRLMLRGCWKTEKYLQHIKFYGSSYAPMRRISAEDGLGIIKQLGGEFS